MLADVVCGIHPLALAISVKLAFGPQNAYFPSVPDFAVHEKPFVSANTTPFSGLVFPLQLVPCRVPASLPQSFGDVTFMVRPIGLRVCGVFALTAICAAYVPGCATLLALVALSVTVTLTVCPTATSNSAEFSSSH